MVNPRDPVLLQSLGLIEYKNSSANLARVLFRRASQLDPRHQPVWIVRPFVSIVNAIEYRINSFTKRLTRIVQALDMVNRWWKTKRTEYIWWTSSLPFPYVLNSLKIIKLVTLTTEYLTWYWFRLGVGWSGKKETFPQLENYTRRLYRSTQQLKVLRVVFR